MLSGALGLTKGVTPTEQGGGGPSELRKEVEKLRLTLPTTLKLHKTV